MILKELGRIKLKLNPFPPLFQETCKFNSIVGCKSAFLEYSIKSIKYSFKYLVYSKLSFYIGIVHENHSKRSQRQGRDRRHQGQQLHPRRSDPKFILWGKKFIWKKKYFSGNWLLFLSESEESQTPNRILKTENNYNKIAENNQIGIFSGFHWSSELARHRRPVHPHRVPDCDAATTRTKVHRIRSRILLHVHRSQRWMWVQMLFSLFTLKQS